MSTPFPVTVTLECAMPVRLSSYTQSAVARDADLAKSQLSESLLRPSSETRAQVLRQPATTQPVQNVVGVGIGEKIVAGRSTGLLAVKVFVRHKFPLDHVPEEHQLPTSLDGLDVDVEQVGTIVAFGPDPKLRYRPLHPGSSVGYEDPEGQVVMAGTLGAIVSNHAGYFILSNNHVLADESRLDPGTPIYQPGLLDGGNPANDEVAKLTRFIPLKPENNTVDCAIAQLDPKIVAAVAELVAGPPTGTATAVLHQAVEKSGRTTGFTTGKVTSVNTDAAVAYETGTFTFTGQIAITGDGGHPFSAAGDSGSLIMDRATGKAVGLLFAGGSTTTFANPIDEVTAALDVSILTSGPVTGPGPHPGGGPGHGGGGPGHGGHGGGPSTPGHPTHT
ncbi:hypothetical protein [Streptomyces durhamensis]|uniref:hypothetical protein n=1 Tax=Streptomyces durhamensis TaxID=68194 RepID=UPI0012FEAD43|nr:hypothetical protein [Streptomyces durhamensis]